MNTKIDNQPMVCKGYIKNLQHKQLTSQEEYIYQTKHSLWVGYEETEIPSSVLSSIISDVERAVLIGYQLGHKHGSKLGREKGFKEALKTLFGRDSNDKDESAA